MADSPSSIFETTLKGLEDKKNMLTETRRRVTKNLVAQTNDEARSGLPYVVDQASIIASSNGTEIFLEELINGLRTNSRTRGESVAVRLAFGRIMEQVKMLGSSNSNGITVPADRLYEIGDYILGAVAGIELRAD